jgi:hypothetical protein
MKRINSLLCSVAYPILESAGVLSSSRLKLEPEPQHQKRQPRTAENVDEAAEKPGDVAPLPNAQL